MENQEQTQAPAPELSVSDLQNIKTVVEVAVRRGAFGAAEMSSVGAVYDKLSAFLAAVAPQQPAQEESAPAEPAAE